MPRPARCPLLLPPLLVLVLASPARAGEVRGNVTPGHGARPAQAVVWVEAVPERVERRLVTSERGWWWLWWRRRARTLPVTEISLAGLRFHPRVVAIAAGSPILLKNLDAVWHGVFSVTPGTTFDVGKREPGREDTLRFNQAGIVALRCDIHPDETAYVVVTPNHAFARPDEHGNWRLPDLPAGHYVLHAWHPERSELRHEVDVPRRSSLRVALRW